MDCDDVALLLAAGEPRTLSGVEETRFARHLAECATCRALADESGDDDRWRWVARVPDDALADPDMLVLPVVDPIVFVSSEAIASGGMGRISRARDRRLGRDVAIKEVLAPEMRARFEREAMITARLQHPAIVPVYEAGTWPDGSAFYTMRLVEGGTLGRAIHDAHTIEQRLALLPHVIAATEAVAYAHSMRVVHRDLKPSNVLVGAFGETVVIDWGLAKELDRPDDDGVAIARARILPVPSDLTEIGSVMGTPGFMSPEQAAGDDELDERADVYALGGILYNLLSGAPPYWDTAAKDDADKLVAAAIAGPPTPIATLAPRAPADLHAIVDRALARPKQARYPTAREMAEELRRFEAGKLIAREYTLRELVMRWIRRHRTAVVVGLIAVVALAVIGAVALVGVTRSRAAERSARRLAEAGVAALLEEHGRAALLAGDRDRALAYLAAAYRVGRDSVGLRHMLASASREVDLRVHDLDSGSSIDAVGFDADGRIVTVEAAANEITRWYRGAVVAKHRLDKVGRIDTAVSPDGRRAAVILLDKRKGPTRIWLAMVDVESGRVMWEVEDETLWSVDELRYDAAGTAIVAVNFEDDPSPAFDVETGARIAAYDLDGEYAWDAAFSPDGSLVVVGGDQAVAVFARAGGSPIARTKLAGVEAVAVEFASDDRVVIGTDDGEALLWRFAADTTQRLAGDRTVRAVATMPARMLIATGDDAGNLKLWNIEGALLAETRETNRLQQLAFSPDGTMLLGGGSGGRVVVWDASTLAVRRSIDAFGDDLGVIAWSHDGTRFATVGFADDSRVARVWAAPIGNLTARFTARSIVTGGGVVASADGNEIAIRDASGAAIATIASPRRATTLSISRDGRRLFEWDRKQTTAYDAATGSPIATYDRTPDVGVDPPRLTRDGRLALEVGSSSEDATPIRVIDAATGAAVMEIAIADASTGDLSPDGSLAVLSAYDKHATMVRVPSGERLAPVAIPGEAGELRFVPSGRRIIAYDSQIASVIDVATGTTLASWDAGVGRWFGAAATDDAGRVVATWTEDSTLVWNADTGALLVSIPDVAKHAFGFTADGSRFAAGFTDGSIQIVETATGRVLDRFRAHRTAIAGLAWTADGKRLVAHAADGATLWDVHLETRSIAEIGDVTARDSTWTVVDGQLVRR